MPARDLSRAPVDKLSLAAIDPEDRISAYFKVHTLTQNEAAVRQRINNAIPTDEVLRSAVTLAREVLDPVRAAYGSFDPISVYRSQALQRWLKNKPPTWLSISLHTMGIACDFKIVGVPTLALADWCARELPQFDEVICQCYDPSEGPHSGWVHVSLIPPRRGSNRRRTLSQVVDPRTGRLVYFPGLGASPRY